MLKWSNKAHNETYVKCNTQHWILNNNSGHKSIRHNNNKTKIKTNSIHMQCSTEPHSVSEFYSNNNPFIIPSHISIRLSLIIHPVHNGTNMHNCILELNFTFKFHHHLTFNITQPILSLSLFNIFLHIPSKTL
jgi:hypothetical protein